MKQKASLALPGRYFFLMEGGTGFEPVNGDFADHSVSLFATRPYLRLNAN